MGTVKLLDCTLREAPLRDLAWGDLSIKKIIDGLENAGIDCIEVGFLKDSDHVPGSTSFKYPEEIRQYTKHKKDNTIYAALVDYGRYDADNLSSCDRTSVDLIRVCFKHDEIDRVLDYASKIREKGYLVSIQHVDTMGYTDEEILDFVYKVNEFKPYAYSIVDTFGAMYEDDMLHYARLINDRLDPSISLGFHGHNNLMMADANAQGFINSLRGGRNIIVDSSLFGCGRGAGNAHTELISQFMTNRHYGSYDINELLDIIDTVITAVQDRTTWGYSIPYFISGLHNAHTFNVKHLLKRHNIPSRDLMAIIDKLGDEQKKKYDYSLLERLYVEHFDNPVDDSTNIDILSNILKKHKILILAPGKSLIEEKEKILNFINNEQPIVIGVNNYIDEYSLDYIFFSSSIRYNNIQYQRSDNSALPSLIITSNIKTTATENEIMVDYKSLIKFGWVNLDSSLIMLLRLLIKCGISDIYAAGLDGYKGFGNAFYKDELDTALDDEERVNQTKDNLSMIRDILSNNPEFTIHFITESPYAAAFEV